MTMNNAQIVEGRTTGRHPLPGDGAMPVSALHFRTGRVDEARALVLQHHYSRRCATNLRFVGSLHTDGGLFGGDGPMVAAALWYTPGTPWKEGVLELGRLVRGERRVPLTFLVSRCTKELKRQGYDLLVSYADSTQGHEGYVYRACNWRYHGKRKCTEDGVLIDGVFKPGRSCVQFFGTRSVSKLRALMPHKAIEPHYDEGKHCFWFPLGTKGEAKAARLGLTPNAEVTGA